MTTTPSPAPGLEELLDAAFRQLQHDTGPQDVEYVHQRRVLRDEFAKILMLRAQPAPATCAKCGYTLNVNCPACRDRQPAPAQTVSEERIRNIRAWNESRKDSLSGAATTVAICDELLALRAASATLPAQINSAQRALAETPQRYKVEPPASGLSEEQEQIVRLTVALNAAIEEIGMYEDLQRKLDYREYADKTNALLTLLRVYREKYGMKDSSARLGKQP